MFGVCHCIFVFFKQKTAYEMRISDGSSDVCSSDLDIVYRDAKRPDDVEPPPQRADTAAAWQREIVPDDVLLFRYSALTFNGHRIHYDRKYVTEEIGRASCREGVCQNVSISVVAGSLKQKTHNTKHAKSNQKQ